MPEVWQVVDGGESVSIDQLNRIAERLVASAGGLRVWFFNGEMGSGKTTLIKAVGSVLGVKEMMSSPTFAIVNEYDGSDGKVNHFDLYRLKNEKEVADIGMDEYFESGGYCLIEWPDRLGNLAVPEHLNIRITVTDPDHRKIEFQRV